MKNFSELKLMTPLQRSIAKERYETPTPIQCRTIPVALEGRDVLGCAQTGTGKTAAFALPILNRLGSQNLKAVPNHPRALVLAPTRELAVQIADSFATYGRFLKLRLALVYGGVSQVRQVRELKRGAHILIATPGRLLDLMNQGMIKLGGLEVFVLDEADRMLDMGFLPDLKKIIHALPEERQSLFFSATLGSNIVDLSKELLRNPVSVNVTPERTSLEGIEQRVLHVEPNQKKELLKKLLKSGDVGQALVFTRTKRAANNVAKHLALSGINATAIHGNKSQNARQRALDAFRSEKVQVLVATDVASRGIDIDGITHVVNYEIPTEPESYIHRIGRTGRAGASGVALSFCSLSEQPDLRAIERLIRQNVPVDDLHSQPGTRTGERAQQPRANSQPSTLTPSNRQRPSRNRKSGRPPFVSENQKRRGRPRRKARKLPR